LLGPEQDGSDIAMRVIRGLAAWVRRYDWNSYQVELVDSSDSSDSSGDDGDDGRRRPIPAPLLVWGPEDVTRRVVNRLLHRPWFERLWVRQEVLLAREAMSIAVFRSSSGSRSKTASVRSSEAIRISESQLYPAIGTSSSRTCSP
jgi:hypothetical protein